MVRRRNGKLYWIAEDGFTAPYIGGGAPEDDPEPPDDDDSDPDDDDDDDDDPKTFTQEDVNRIVQKKERKLRRSITRELEDELGVSLDEAKSIVKKVQSGEKPDALAEVNRLRQELDDREGDLNQREIQMTVRERLQESGIKPTRLKRAVRLVDLDEDPDDDDILAAIAELKDDMPELFESDEDRRPDPEKRVPSSTTKTPRRRSHAREDAFAEGAKLAKQFQSSTL